MQKQVIGLLNSTLKGIRITTGECSEESATLVARGILSSIKDKSVKGAFIDYVFSNYTILL